MTESVSHKGNEVSPLRLKIIIVGSGIGGLTAAATLGRAGHDVTVLEATDSLKERGAGIQLSPNATRLLLRWGLEQKIQHMGVEPHGLTLRRYDTGTQVGAMEWGNMRSQFGAPYCHFHRADLLSALFDLATPFMDHHLESRVVAVVPTDDNQATEVRLSDGSCLKADMVVGADGIHSTVRSAVIASPIPAIDTGDSAYRVVIDAIAMRASGDPDLIALIEEKRTTVWMGPKKHIVGYCISGQKQYNLVMTHPHPTAKEAWDVKASVESMREEYRGWDPRIHKLLNYASESWEWKLVIRNPLETWVDPSGRVVLLGDSKSATLPYLAQGAAMAIEDSAVLGKLFSRVTDRSMIPQLLRGYEGLRKERCTRTQIASYRYGEMWNLEDGPEQEQRDKMLTESWKSGKPPENREDRGKIAAQFLYDADAEVEAWWKQAKSEAS